MTGKQIAVRAVIVIVAMAAVGGLLGAYGERLGLTSPMQAAIRTIALGILVVTVGLWRNRRPSPPPAP